MIQTCEKCGGLFATEDFEMFAGTPCLCGHRIAKKITAQVEITSSNWLECVTKSCERTADTLESYLNNGNDLQCLVFSEMVEMLRMLSGNLRAEVEKHSHARMSGQHQPEKGNE